ncbi:hypothetical protein EU538_08075 [Candidatus Thorarchaeota archaeon]|nr:MAG: hypothetical protein EU538_08075 [Candidatus Thorarchaeota archaeon]
MRSELELSFGKLMNPRMMTGLMLLYSLLEPIKGPNVAPKDVRKSVNKIIDERKVSKQSITNAARRLEEAHLIDRTEGYSVNYGYVTSVLLNALLDLTQKVTELEEELEELKEDLVMS